MKTLGVDVDRFDTAFDTKLYAGLGLSFGVFFDRENFGTDRLVAGSPLGAGADPTPGNTAKTKPIPEFIGEFPLSPDAIKRLTDFFATPKDYLAGKSDDEKIAHLESTSYRDYLKTDAGLGEEAVKYFEGLTLDYWAVGIDAVSAYDAMDSGYPGFDGLALPSEDGRGQRALHLSFPGRQRVDRAAAGAQPHPGGSGRLDDGRHRACRFRLFQARPGRPADPHPPLQHRGRRPQCARRQGPGRYRLCPGRYAASRAGQAMRARLLQHDHPLSHAGIAGCAEGGAGRERQGAAGLCQRGDPQLAVLREARRAADLQPDRILPADQARLSRGARRLQQSAQPRRADGRCTWCMCRSSRTRA